jgi:hypothetical protein
MLPCVVSGLRREVKENCALLSYCAASSGKSFPTFRDNLSVAYSKVTSPDSCTWKMKPIGCSETSVGFTTTNLEERSSQRCLHLQYTLRGMEMDVEHKVGFAFNTR